MAEDQGKEEEKFDFTGEGEAVNYISLAQARVLAIQTAREIHSSGGGPCHGLYGCIGHAANVVGGVRCTVGTLEDRGAGRVSP